MKNYTKNNIGIFILNFIFSFSIVCAFFLDVNLTAYKKNLAEKIFIVAFSENIKTADKAARKIRKIEGVRNVQVETPKETMAKLYQGIKRKELLPELRKMSVPVVIRVHPGKADFRLFKKIAAEIVRIREVNHLDDGGNNVKNIFIFSAKIKKINRLINIMLLFICLTSGIFTRIGLKSIDERFLFLTERNLGKKEIYRRHCLTLILIPLISAGLAVLLFVLLWQTAGGGEFLFPKPVQILFVFILSNIPALSLTLAK